MKEIVQSAWWIVYYLDNNWEPRYLLIKRHALSWKIERVAPKWKIQIWEDEKKAAINSVKLIEWEWYIWIYKRASIEEVLWLMYYADIRELVRKSYFLIREEKKNQWVKANFLDKL